MPPDNYLGHQPELIEHAVVLPHGNFVRLNDMLFEQHGLGPRYAQVQTNNYRQHRSLSYAYWNLPGTTYDLITKQDDPQDLGGFDNLIAVGDMFERLKATFINRSCHHPTPQQLALALIRAQVESVESGDELGAHRLVKWVLIYERRAHWIATHRQLAFSKLAINWQALGL